MEGKTGLSEYARKQKEMIAERIKNLSKASCQSNLMPQGESLSWVPLRLCGKVAGWEFEKSH